MRLLKFKVPFIDFFFFKCPSKSQLDTAFNFQNNSCNVSFKGVISLTSCRNFPFCFFIHQDVLFSLKHFECVLINYNSRVLASLKSLSLSDILEQASIIEVDIRVYRVISVFCFFMKRTIKLNLVAGSLAIYFISFRICAIGSFFCVLGVREGWKLKTFLCTD